MDFKKDFPIFTERPELIYLDSGATSQKPQAVLTAVDEFYSRRNSNIHRGPHFLAEEATASYEDARRSVADFIGASATEEIVFTKNATEALNLVARSFGETLSAGDVVLLSKLEHHANIVPWLQLKDRIGIELRYFDVTDDGFIKFDSSLIDERVKLVSVSGMSNTLGTITDLPPIIRAAHEAGAKVLVDAAQLAVHRPIDVEALDVDFLVFTGHKLYGPTGIGVLYGKADLLKNLPPFLTGGDMVNEVFTDRFTHAELPSKFEAGTPPIAQAVGLKAAIEYINKIGFDVIQQTEHKLTDYLLEKLKTLPYITIFGPTDNPNSDQTGGQNSDKSESGITETRRRGSIVSFTMQGVHAHDVAEGLSQKHICIRAGQHCTQPLHDACNIPATARISLAFYNTKAEIDRTIEVLNDTYNYFH